MAIDIGSSPSRVLWSTGAGDSWTNLPAPTAGLKWYGFGKQALDFTLALLLGLVAVPVLAIVSLVVKLTSRGPVFYSQTRVGRFGKPFTIYKVRSMRHRCESTSGAQWSTPGDPRVTFIGRILRKTHIDELPQLWNVLRGDMSLVGPRPERPEFVPQLEKHIPCYSHRLLVKPGITGLAQVQLPPDTDLESVRRKLACDLFYVGHMNLWLDLRLMLCTGLVFFGIPYSFSRSLFRIPCRNRAEKHYTEAVSRSASLELQPA